MDSCSVQVCVTVRARKHQTIMSTDDTLAADLLLCLQTLRDHTHQTWVSATTAGCESEDVCVDTVPQCESLPSSEGGFSREPKTGEPAAAAASCDADRFHPED